MRDKTKKLLGMEVKPFITIKIGWLHITISRIIKEHWTVKQVMKGLQKALKD